MTFLTLPILAVLAGLAAIGLGLFLLQQLRARNTPVAVPTLMFWRASVKEAPVRVFRDRFRHLWAYLLCLLICSLIWLAFSDPATDSNDQISFHVLFLDGSAHTSNPDDFEVAKQELLTDLRDFPEHKREVFFGNARTLKILTTGEHYRIAERRLQEVTPEGSVSSLGEFIRLFNAADRFPQGTQLIVYGNVPVDESLLLNLPEDVSFVQHSTQTGGVENSGITALGWADSSTGNWSLVDVSFQIESTEDALASTDFSVVVDGQEIASEDIQKIDESSYLIQDLPANGAVLTVRLGVSDSLPVDDEARLQLPTKRPIRVKLDDAVNEAIALAIQADPGIEVVDSDEQVSIQTNAVSNVEVPSLQLVASNDLENSIEYTYQPGDDIESIRQRTLELGLDRIEPLSPGSSQVEISVEFTEGQVRSISFADQLLDEMLGYQDSYAFPLYIASAIRWLADDQAQFSYAAVGRPLIAQNRLDSLSLSEPFTDQVLGANFIPPRAETLSDELTDSLEVALLSPKVTNQFIEQVEVDSEEQETGVVFAGLGSIGLWLTLLAMAFLAFEWYLYRRRLMP